MVTQLKSEAITGYGCAEYECNESTRVTHPSPRALETI